MTAHVEAGGSLPLVKGPTTTFEIRIPNLKPESLPLGELAEVLTSLQDALLGLLSDDGKPVVVSLVAIKNHSTGLLCRATSPEAATAYDRLAKAVATGKVDSLPQRSQRGLTKLQTFSAKRGKVLQFRSRQPRARAPLAILAPETNLFGSRATRFSGQTDLYGKVEKVGGLEPRVVLRLADGHSVNCEADIPTAVQLAQALYKWVGVSGKATWDTTDAQAMTAFRIERILPYQDVPPTEAIARLAKLIGPYWSDVEDVEAEVRKLREFN